MHGGMGGAPKGRRNGNWRHGRRTCAAEAEARRFGAVIRHLHGVARSMEESVRELWPLLPPIRYEVERVRVLPTGEKVPWPKRGQHALVLETGACVSGTPHPVQSGT
jgi:hypothetical protein